MKNITSMSFHGKRFWGEALRTVIDFINLSPCIPLDDGVVEHVKSKKDVSYKNLKEFLCGTFAQVLDVERSKF